MEEILGCSDSLDLQKNQETGMRMPLASLEGLPVSRNYVTRISMTLGIFKVRQLPTASPR